MERSIFYMEGESLLVRKLHPRFYLIFQVFGDSAGNPCPPSVTSKVNSLSKTKTKRPPHVTSPLCMPQWLNEVSGFPACHFVATMPQIRFSEMDYWDFWWKTWLCHSIVRLFVRSSSSRYSQTAPTARLQCQRNRLVDSNFTVSGCLGSPVLW